MSLSLSIGSVRVQDVLSAYRYVILQQQDPTQQHEPTANEYFALILKVLTMGGDLNNNLLETLRILEGIIPSVSKELIREQFRPITTIIGRIAQMKDVQSDDKYALRIMSVLGAILLAQDCSEGFWSSLPALQVLNMFLSLIDDERTPLRKLVHQQLFSLLQHHKQQKAKPLFAYIKDFSLGVLKSATKSQYKRSLYLLFFLESSLGLFPGEMIVPIVDSMIRLQLCEQNLLNATIFRTLDATFQSPYISMTADQSNRLVSSLVSMKPMSKDMETNTFYCNCVATAFVLLFKNSPTFARSQLPSVTRILVDECESDFTQVHCSACLAIKRLLTTALDPTFVHNAALHLTNTQATAGSGVGKSEPSVQTVRVGKKGHTAIVIGEASAVGATAGPSAAGSDDLINTLRILHQLMQLKFQQSWIYSLDVMRVLFESITKSDAVTLLSPFVTSIADTIQGIEMNTVPVDTERSVLLSSLLGTSLKSTGLQAFLTLAPLRSSDTEPIFGIDVSREWLVQLISSQLKSMPCRLADFMNCILPIARQCNQIALKADEYELTPAQLKKVKSHVVQLWSLFPSFCVYGATDVSSSLPGMMKSIEFGLSDTMYPEIRHQVVVGLTHLAKSTVEKSGLTVEQLVAQSIQNPTASTDFNTLRNLSNKLLPMFLMIIEQLQVTDNEYPALLHCVTAWSTIAPNELVVACGKNLLKLLLVNNAQILSHGAPVAGKSEMQVDGDDDSTGNKMMEVAAGWVSVMQAIIPSLPAPMIALIYKTIKPLLSVHESVPLQKRAYHVLEALIKYHGTVLFATEALSSVLGLITDSLLTCHVSARNIRLRCLEVLIQHIPDEELLGISQAVMGEILLCLKDSNKKSRDSSMNLLKYMIGHIPSINLLTLLCSGLVGETVVMRVSSITGICVLLLERRHDELLQNQVVQLMDTICVLLREEVVEETRAVMSFLRVCANVIPKDTLLPILPQFIVTFTEGLGIFKQKFTFRVRAILRKLIQKVGADAVQPHVPEIDQPLFQYIQRQARRSNRRKNDKAKYEKTLLEKMLGSDDDDDDEDFDDGFSTGQSDDMDEDGRSVAKSDRSRMSSRSKASFYTGERDEEDDDGDEEDELNTDRRLLRTKATRPSDFKSSLPTSLADMIDEDDRTHTRSADSKPNLKAQSQAALTRQNTLKNSGAAGGKATRRKSFSRAASITAATATATDPADGADDEDYIVTTNKDGMVVVKENKSKSKLASGMDISSGSVGLVPATDDDAAGSSKLTGKRKGASEHALSSENAGRYGKQSAADAAAEERKKKLKVKQPGEEYRTNKAGGDVWKRGMLQPHAYIPLDPRLLNKKKHREAVDMFASVVKNRTNAGSGAGGKSTNVSRFRKATTGSRKQRESARAHGK